MPRPDPKVPGGYMPPAANNATTAGAHVGGGHDSSMSGPVVAGIAVGSVALLGLIAGLLFLYYRKRRQGQGARGQQRRKGGGGHIALRSAPSPAASSSPFLSTTAMPPPRPPRSPKRQRHSEGLLFACQGEREQQPSSRSGTPRDGGLCMSPTAQEHDKAVLAYSSPEAPYYGIISPMREKPDYYQHHHHHQNQQPQHGSAYS